VHERTSVIAKLHIKVMVRKRELNLLLDECYAAKIFIE